LVIGPNKLAFPRLFDGINIKKQTNVKDGGQECPPYAGLAETLLSLPQLHPVP